AHLFWPSCIKRFCHTESSRPPYPFYFHVFPNAKPFHASGPKMMRLEQDTPIYGSRPRSGCLLRRIHACQVISTGLHDAPEHFCLNGIVGNALAVFTHGLAPKPVPTCGGHALAANCHDQILSLSMNWNSPL